MIKTEVVTANNPYMLSELINDWIKTNPGKLVTNVYPMPMYNGTCCAMIVYKVLM